jgi:hypothetical protein
LDLNKGNFEFKGSKGSGGSSEGLSIQCNDEGVLFKLSSGKGTLVMNTYNSQSILSFFSITDASGQYGLMGVGDGFTYIQGLNFAKNPNTGGYFDLEGGRIICQEIILGSLEWHLLPDKLAGYNEGNTFFSVNNLGETYIGGNTTIEGKATINGGLKVKEETSLVKLTVLDDCEIKGFLVCDNLTINGNLTCSNLECSGRAVHKVAYEPYEETIDTIEERTIYYASDVDVWGSGSGDLTYTNTTYTLVEDGSDELGRKYKLEPYDDGGYLDVSIDIHSSVKTTPVNIAVKGTSSKTIAYLGRK